ncbi:hypothetical protein CJ030_MR1G007356 [Morella rubra]|uniref:Uncharacterized protein n=1 Tax=Morella rubra TaxID=262757 RepID=A0A6A1WQ77_9ROSI|nr:hypothetical protein CJ030_MR1G007356 [Morella rubra]
MLVVLNNMMGMFFGCRGLHAIVLGMVRVKLPAQRVPSPPPRMTRKRKAASASTSKSSKSRASQEDREPEILEDFNDALFYNLEAETLFHTKFSLKRIELEKEVLIEELSHLPVIGQLTSRGWSPLLHHLSPPPASVFDMAVTRLELSQVRADIKLLQPFSDVDLNGTDGAAEDAEGTEESAEAEDVSSDSES